MDAFFAAIEQLDNPSLRGKPILVGGDGSRGVVATASYEARVFGCHSAQPMSVAKRLCPHAIVVPGRYSRYREVSDAVFDIMESFTPLVQPLSIDEAFLDVTGSQRLHGSAIEIATKLKARVKNELHLTPSVGVAPNKFLAKLASDLEKPDGLVVIDESNVDTILPPLPVSKIWGIGPKTAARLDSNCIRTIADIRKATEPTLKRLFGDDAERVSRLARGQDDREVVTDSAAKQISQERTFGTDIPDPDSVRNELHDQVQQVARRLRKHNFRAQAVTLKIRFGEFQTISRSTTLSEPTDRTDLLWNASLDLFTTWSTTQFRPVRLIGMAAKNLTQSQGQLNLFPDPKDQRQQTLDRTVDKINARFGTDALKRGA